MIKTENFEVENLKCSGCAATVKKKLLDHSEISSVEVDLEKGVIQTTFEGELDRNQIYHELAGLGYPEKGKGNLFQKGKSYVSCAIGKMNQED